MQMVLGVAAALAAAFSAPAPAAAQQAPAAASPAVAADVAAVLASGDRKALGEVVDRLRRGGKADRAAFGLLLERLQPVAKAVPAAGAGAPDPASASPRPEAMRQWVADLAGADAAKADAARERLAAAAAAGDAEVKQLVERADELLANCVMGAFHAQVESRAVFAGQYAALADYGPPVLRLLQHWIDKPPSRGPAATIKVNCIRALRDCVTGKPDAALAALLKKTAKDALEDRDVVKEAGFALAQFGDRSVVEAELQSLTRQTQAKSELTRAHAFADLADLYFNVRDYGKAADLHRQHLALVESSAEVRKAEENLAAVYYNACCAMALAGQADPAFACLDKAIAAGKEGGKPLPRTLLETDMDLAPLRADPRFAAALARLGGR